MRENGYYWCEVHEFGSIDVVAYHDGRWIKDWVINEEDVTVISEPLAIPTLAELTGHTDRLARIGLEIFAEDGADPRWDGVHVDGAYWIKRDGYKPEIALSLEGGWCSYLLGLPGYDWEIYPGKPPPNVLFGPLDKPGGRHRQSTYLATLLEYGRQQEAAAAKANAVKPRRKAKTAKPLVLPKAKLN